MSRKKNNKYNKLLIACGTVAMCALLWRPVSAGITSLWTDDATLLKQLLELMQINDELSTVSGHTRLTAAATDELLRRHRDTDAAIAALHAFGPAASWRAFVPELYEHYPALGAFAAGQRLDRWQRTRSPSPMGAQNAIADVFGDIDAPLRARERRGDLDTQRMRILHFEAAGALSLANDAERATRGFDDDARVLLEQAESVGGGDEAAVLSAKALAQIAAQQSQIIRLLSRDLRIGGVEAALEYKAQIDGLRDMEAAGRGVNAHFGSAGEAPRMMDFRRLW
jgi:hypothetical protein